MRPPVAVMFDWCGTIVQRAELNHAAIRKALERVGRDDIDVSAVPYNKVVKYLAYELGNKWEEAFRLYEEIKAQSPQEQQWFVNEGIIELLEFLKAKDVSMGIVSNKNGGCLREEVEKAKLSKYFPAIIGSGDTLEDKPSPKPLIAALEILGISPSEQVFFIGDSISDVESAKSARCMPIVYGHGGAGLTGVLSFTNFRDFCTFVQKLLN